MKPGSLRLVSQRPDTGERKVEEFSRGEEGQFYAHAFELGDAGYELWMYEMTDKGWTEF